MNERIRLCGDRWVYCDSNCKDCPITYATNTTTTTKIEVVIRPIVKYTDDSCTLCGQIIFHGDAHNYCPKCGAKLLDQEVYE